MKRWGSAFARRVRCWRPLQRGRDTAASRRASLLDHARACEREGDWLGAASAYLAGLDDQPTASCIAELRRVVKQVAMDDEAAAHDIIEDASRALGGEEAAARVLGNAIENMRISVLGRHKFVLHRQASCGLPAQGIVHKLTTFDAEAALLALLEERHADLPEGLAIPRLMGIDTLAPVHHVFMEYLELPSRRGSADPTRMERRAAHIAELAALQTIDERFVGLPNMDYSAPRLERLVDVVRRSAAFRSAAAEDPELHRGLDLLAAHVDDVAAIAASLPTVVSNNDLTVPNAALTSTDRGDRLIVLDWGDTTLNLAGADLHVDAGAGIPDDRFHATVDVYVRHARAYLPDVDGDTATFAARVYNFVRGARPRKPWMSSERVPTQCDKQRVRRMLHNARLALASMRVHALVVAALVVPDGSLDALVGEAITATDRGA